MPDKQTTKAQDAFEQAVLRLAEEDGMAAALSSVTASFVGLVLFSLESAGHEPGGEVVIDGGPTARDITIHAPKRPLQ